MNAETICYSKIFTQSARSSSQNSAPAASISYALSVLLYARHAPFNAMLNVSTKSYRKIVFKPVLITLTVKNGSDLAERSEHLMKSFRTLLERRRDYEKKGAALTSSVRCRALCTPMKTPSTRKQ